jgi:hypothetical protein
MNKIVISSANNLRGIGIFYTLKYLLIKSYILKFYKLSLSPINYLSDIT